MHSSLAFLCKQNSVGITFGSSRSQAEPLAGPAVSDEEDSEDSSASQHALAQQKTKTSPAAADGDRQYFWRDAHQDAMAEFWLGHPIFYDKAQQHYKNKEMKLQLMQELIRHNRETWEKLHSPLPTGE